MYAHILVEVTLELVLLVVASIAVLFGTMLDVLHFFA